ncbi:MAG: hypothetical protein AAFX07_12085 [Pseudomonadota bacterium]
MSIRKIVILSTLAIGLTGCGPLPLYYKEGEKVSQIDTILTQCRVESLAKVPVAERRRYIPPVFAHRTFQAKDGTHFTRRVLVQRGGFETFDANEGLREEVTDQCMVTNGFQQVRIPKCDGSLTRATTIRATEVLPPLTTESCAIRIRDGKFQIVSR